MSYRLSLFLRGLDFHVEVSDGDRPAHTFEQIRRHGGRTVIDPSIATHILVGNYRSDQRGYRMPEKVDLPVHPGDWKIIHFIEKYGEIQDFNGEVVRKPRYRPILVTKDWLDACLKAGRLIETAPYEVYGIRGRHNDRRTPVSPTSGPSLLSRIDTWSSPCRPSSYRPSPPRRPSPEPIREGIDRPITPQDPPPRDQVSSHTVPLSTAPEGSVRKISPCFVPRSSYNPRDDPRLRPTNPSTVSSAPVLPTLPSVVEVASAPGHLRSHEVKGSVSRLQMDARAGEASSPITPSHGGDNASTEPLVSPFATPRGIGQSSVTAYRSPIATSVVQQDASSGARTECSGTGRSTVLVSRDPAAPSQDVSSTGISFVEGSRSITPLGHHQVLQSSDRTEYQPEAISERVENIRIDVEVFDIKVEMEDSPPPITPSELGIDHSMNSDHDIMSSTRQEALSSRPPIVSNQNVRDRTQARTTSSQDIRPQPTKRKSDIEHEARSRREYRSSPAVGQSHGRGTTQRSEEQSSPSQTSEMVRPPSATPVPMTTSSSVEHFFVIFGLPQSFHVLLDGPHRKRLEILIKHMGGGEIVPRQDAVWIVLYHEPGCMTTDIDIARMAHEQVAGRPTRMAVSYRWIDECMDQGRMVDPRPYQITFIPTPTVSSGSKSRSTSVDGLESLRAQTPTRSTPPLVAALDMDDDLADFDNLDIDSHSRRIFDTGSPALTEDDATGPVSGEFIRRDREFGHQPDSNHSNQTEDVSRFATSRTKWPPKQRAAIHEEDQEQYGVLLQILENWVRRKHGRGSGGVQGVCQRADKNHPGEVLYYTLYRRYRQQFLAAVPELPRKKVN